MKKTKLRLWLLLTALWLALIFAHSAMPADLSRAESGGILAFLQRFFPWLSHNALRKFGHFAEYAVAGFLLARTVLLTKRPAFSKPLLFGVLTALADETLQLFVEGRSGQVTDVWLDTAGALLGISIVWLFHKIRRK